MSLVTVFNVLYWVWVVSEVVLIVVTRTKRKSGETRDRGSLLVLWGVIFGSIWVGTWYGLSHPHTIFGGAVWVREVALAVLVVGMAVRWTAIVQLGRSFSVNVAIHATQTVHKSGLFGVVRHPSYTGLMLVFVAVGLWYRNWVALAVFVVPPMVALMYRMKVEERALGEAFGADYVEYMRETKRLIPGVY